MFNNYIAHNSQHHACLKNGAIYPVHNMRYCVTMREIASLLRNHGFSNTRRIIRFRFATKLSFPENASFIVLIFSIQSAGNNFFNQHVKLSFH